MGTNSATLPGGENVPLRVSADVRLYQLERKLDALVKALDAEPSLCIDYDKAANAQTQP